MEKLKRDLRQKDEVIKENNYQHDLKLKEFVNKEQDQAKKFSELEVKFSKVKSKVAELEK